MDDSELDGAEDVAAVGAELAVDVLADEQAAKPTEIATVATPIARLFRDAVHLSITMICSIHGWISPSTTAAAFGRGAVLAAK
jgi:hypothetical protein